MEFSRWDYAANSGFVALFRTAASARHGVGANKHWAPQPRGTRHIHHHKLAAFVFHRAHIVIAQQIAVQRVVQERLIGWDFEVGQSIFHGTYPGLLINRESFGKRGLPQRLRALEVGIDFGLHSKDDGKPSVHFSDDARLLSEGWKWNRQTST